ncbi:LTA synthase family protein [Planococcus sp. N028]|uniref:LTA synthase family protein n=1 Tax=Planococcus shixiaomingii TaxID=3058393 RepID=A0ABT8N2T8_9BACL|nr:MULTISPECIES: LTA synthase family protein [unclassified Planococcus (in: firmicutes)]MDN7242014.1 LTA synthase family protein [Planococcus sp. N028]WKA54293.1 LTA synthase family protein [Planococcus sp. N022]
MKKSAAFPYPFLFLFLLIKVIAFRVLIFDTKSLVSILLIEFPMWALLLSLVLMAVKKRVWLAVWIYNFLVSVIFFTVTLYIRYYSTIPSYYDLQQTTQSGSVGRTIVMLSNPFDFLFFLDAVLVIILARKWAAPKQKWPLKYAAVALALIGATTTTYALQQPIVDVSYFAKENGYIQSQVVQMYHRSNETAHASFAKLSPKQLEALKGNEYVEMDQQKGFGLAKDRHLFVIQVESLQNFVIGKSVNGQEITPNLNKLLEESAYFSNVFQQIGAGTTSDAEWIANTGLYPQGMIPTVNSLNGEEVPSLPRTLQTYGYGSATYHADDVTFWNRDVLYPVLGYDEVYSNEEIPNIKPVGFGPADEVVFDFAAKKLPKQLVKYDRIYANIVTVTSHTPFVMPEEMQHLDLPAEYEDMYIGNYLQSVRYADEQIGAFIEELKDQGLYDTSLIAIFGDHSGMHGSLVTEEDQALIEDFIGHPYTLKDQFTVPLLFTGGNLFNGIQMERLGGQVDIMPTILALLGIEHETPMMGHNLFHYEKNLLGMRYYMPGGSFIQSEQIYKAPGAKLPEVLYDMKSMGTRGKNSETKKHIRDTDTLLNYGDLLLEPYLKD